MSLSDSGNFLSITGSYKSDPQDASAFASIATESMAKSVGKPGCLYYILSQDLTEPNVFHLADGWASQTASDEHLASADFRETLEEAFRLRILSREIYVSTSTGRTLLS